jgi:hypothetical protein
MGFWDQSGRLIETSSRCTLSAAGINSDAVPLHRWRSAIISRTQAATGAALHELDAATDAASRIWRIETRLSRPYTCRQALGSLRTIALSGRRSIASHR